MNKANRYRKRKSTDANQQNKASKTRSGQKYGQVKNLQKNDDIKKNVQTHETVNAEQAVYVNPENHAQLNMDTVNSTGQSIDYKGKIIGSKNVKSEKNYDRVFHEIRDEYYKVLKDIHNAIGDANADGEDGPVQCKRAKIDAEQCTTASIDDERCTATKIDDEQQIERKIDTEQFVEEQIDVKLVVIEQIEAKHVDEEQINVEQFAEAQIDVKPLVEEQIEAKQLDEEQIDAEQFAEEQIDVKLLVEEQIEAKQLDEEQIDAEQFAEAQTDIKQFDEEKIEAKHVNEDKIDAKELIKEKIDPKNLAVEKINVENKIESKIDANKTEINGSESLIYPPNLGELHYDYLEAIFKKCDLNSLLHLAQLNKNLRHAASVYFRQKYQQKLVSIHCLFVYTKREIGINDDEILINDFRTCLEFLRSFGDDIKKLELMDFSTVLSSIHDKKNRFCFNLCIGYVIQYCTESVEEICIIGNPLDVLRAFRFEKPFLNVKKLSINHNGFLITLIAKIFPNVRFIELKSHSKITRLTVRNIRKHCKHVESVEVIEFGHKRRILD